MKTQHYYQLGLWDAIIEHPQYDLGQREIEALWRSLHTLSGIKEHKVNVLHLGAGNGREIPLLITELTIGKYLINDICEPLLARVSEEIRQRFPLVTLLKVCGDVQDNDTLRQLRQQLNSPTLVALIGNGVIFADGSLDAQLTRALQSDDLLLVTIESPHEGMFSSYDIEPVYELLSQSGILANRSNTRIEYEAPNQQLTMWCQGQALLSSYKPTCQQLLQRLKRSGLKAIQLEDYQDIHMIAGLFGQR